MAALGIPALRRTIRSAAALIKRREVAISFARRDISDANEVIRRAERLIEQLGGKP